MKLSISLSVSSAAMAVFILIKTTMAGDGTNEQQMVQESIDFSPYLRRRRRRRLGRQLQAIPKPTDRFTEWSALDQSIQDAATVVGYEVDEWNLVNVANFEMLAYEDLDTLLTPTQIEAIGTFIPLGEDQWDCWIHHYEDYDWDELEGDALAAYVALGWTMNSWEGNGSPPDTEDLDFEELTPEQQVAVEGLCLDQLLWDGVAIPFWQSQPVPGCILPGQSCTLSGLTPISRQAPGLEECCSGFTCRHRVFGDGSATNVCSVAPSNKKVSIVAGDTKVGGANHGTRGGN